MRADAAIIGGTGIGERLRKLGGKPAQIATRFGKFHYLIVQIAGKRVAVVSRHGAGHKLPPHKVNYRALAAGAKKLGVKMVFSTAAVGSLREDWTAGHMAVCSGFIDLSGRNVTVFDTVVQHTDFSEPFSSQGRCALLRGAKGSGAQVHDGGVYVCANGPRYETPDEIRAYRTLGGDVVGMTAATEAIVMKEIGIPYACLAIVTNLATGISTSPLSHEEVVREMERSGERALAILTKATALVDEKS
jgi:5'-methylthioadenosine phosphorylase